MHSSSLVNMKKFVDKYMDVNISYKILDLGSQVVHGDINGSYRQYFEKPKWTYEGADLISGNNVDIVLQEPYRWKNIKSKTYDCVVCGQMFEHNEYFWLTMLEIKRILKSDGLCCIIAPSGGPEHKYPVDCYRFYPDGLKAVAKYVGMESLEVYAQWNEDLYPDMDSEWRDCVLICRKPKESFKESLNFFFMYYMIQAASGQVNQIQYHDSYTLETTWKTPMPNLMSTVYFDTGRGFNEEEIERYKVSTHHLYTRRYRIPSGCIAVRFDPVESYRCIVRNFRVFTNVGAISLDQWESNGEYKGEGEFFFQDTVDPQIFIPEIKKEQYDWIEISANIYIVI